MSQFAIGAMLGLACFFVGVVVGLLSAAIVDLQSKDNPNNRRRLCQRGESLLRDHGDLETIELKRSKVKPSQVKHEQN